MRRSGPNDGDFSGRYRAPRVLVPPGVAEEEQKLQESVLRSFGSRAGRPAGLERFEQMVLRPSDFVGDGPLVGTFCNFVPEEIVEAAGAVPVRLCTGSIVAQSIAEQVLPRDACPVARASFGAVVGGLGMAPHVKALVLPAACDAKRRLGELLRDHVPVIALSIPGRSDHRTELGYWLSELGRLAQKLAEITGQTPTRARLRDAIMRRRAVQDAFRELERARRDSPHVLTGSDLAMVAAASFHADPLRWADACGQLAAEVREAGRDGPLTDGAIPLVMTGAPLLWPAWKLYRVIEEVGASVVADTLCSATQRLYDPVQVDDWSRSGMMRALALRYFSASLCPCFVDSTAHADRVIELAREWQAAGVVAHNLRLCQLFQIQSARLRHILRDEGIPFLAIDTELGPEDVEQIRVRVEAFLEMVKEQGRTQ